MADFSFRCGQSMDDANVLRFRELYKNKLEVVVGGYVFYNDKTITHIMEGTDSISLLGYAYVVNRDLTDYLKERLRTFAKEDVMKIKKEMLGQYLVIVRKGTSLYCFADFLQTRQIYYDADGKRAGSSFTALDARNTNDYKAFEYLAMRHCIYPGLLGNTTLDDSIKSLRAWEYLQINIETGVMDVHHLIFILNNRKNYSVEDCTNTMLSVLRDSLQHPNYKNKRVVSTQTGGFDTRLITALVNEYYQNMHLRISTFKDEYEMDLSIATEVAKVLGYPLHNYSVNFERQKDRYYYITEGLMPRTNGIMIEELEHTADYELGFGGRVGTELFSADVTDTTIEFVERVRQQACAAIKAERSYFERYYMALSQEFEEIKRHYLLIEPDDRDIVKLFRLMNTAFFMSPTIAAYNIYGMQFDVIATYPVIEAALQIPYEFQGGTYTFGRFYMIPKAIVGKINPQIAKLMTTHFCPMRPLGIRSLLSYIAMKKEGKRYYEQQAKLQKGQKNELTYKSDTIQYTSDHWYEGFLQTWLK
jgi:hypothetical protein